MATSYYRLEGTGLLLNLDYLVTCRLAMLAPGASVHGYMLDDKGRQVDSVALRYAACASHATGVPAQAVELACGNGAVTMPWLAGFFEGRTPLFSTRPYARFNHGVTVRRAEGVSGLEPPAESFEVSTGANVDITKPFFVGQDAIAGRFPAVACARWSPPPIARSRPLDMTLLGPEHERIGVSQWGPFGSCTMPIQYAAGPAAIGQEHLATRCSAALYDVSHMLPIVVKGRGARALLETCLVNSILDLIPGRCQYSGILRPDGTPMDDVYVSCIESDCATGEEVFLLVANSGHEEDYWYLKAVADGSVAIDESAPSKRFLGDVSLVSRLEPVTEGGAWSAPLYSVSLQGPKSRDMLLVVVDGVDRARVDALKFNDLASRVRIRALEPPVIVTRTGYCGEPVGYEVYAEAGGLVALWRDLLEAGAVPAGLGARDSTRQEAGLPLFGHEIGGPLDIPFTGGRYPKMVSFRKPFFVGRAAAWDAESRRKRRVFLLVGEGPRKVSQGWLVYSPDGRLLGRITSTSTIRPGKTDVTQAYLEEEGLAVGTRVIVVPESKAPRQGQRPDGRAFVVSTWDKARDYTCG